ncbi:uncharacterized protein YggT (Ycf19 family) [Alkalibacillus flavidus]|uniref:Uncharacterized protein YggT (Ycf19 family) n=1 Tax=Alkalibacillus flavidus TaxID=546021 RepID=A0ABV2KWC2_9BACI
MRVITIINQLINIIVWVIQAILGLRIILKLFGASETAPFVEWIYQWSEPLLYPFAGIFPSTVLDGTYVIEFSAIFAFIVYTMLGYFISAIILGLGNRFNRPSS